MSFWSDLLDSGKDYAESEIRSKAEQAKSQGIDHIPVQNETVARFGQILDAYNAGQLSATAAAAEIQKWDRAFTVFAQQLNNSRATRGATDVHNLATRILSGLGASPGLPPAGGFTIPGTNQTISTTTALVIGGLLFFYFTKGRRG